jgi:4-amino-4-deoxy-L-arabinose transferase-like glycosyltransferase
VDVMTAVLLGAALVAYLALAWGYAVLTPIWQNPDEPAHYNYIAYISDTGGLPELKSGDWDSALLERLKNGQLQPGDSFRAIRYESWQPPLFYGLAAPVYRLGPIDDPPAMVLRLRALDAVFGALTLAVAYLVAREFLPGRIAAAVPLTMVGVPMFVAVSAAISADPLANLLSAAILLLLVRRIRDPVEANRRRWAVATGVMLGLGLLAKLALAIFVPLALVVIAIRSSRPIRDGLLTLMITAGVVTPWLVHQLTTYGWADPLAIARHAAVVADQPRFPGLSPAYIAQFAQVSFHSFWAQFGWMAVVAPERLYWIWGAISAMALVGLVVRPRRLPWLMVLSVALGLAAYLAYNLSFEQFQGRYLFPVLVPIAVLLVIGWAGWVPRRFQALAVSVLSCALIALNGYALWRVLVPGFAPIGG